MVDISKCEGTDCPLKEKCYRYLAKPDEHLQAYFTIPPYSSETKSCEYFWDVDSKYSKSVLNRENNGKE